jgi:hypothetical protein
MDICVRLFWVCRLAPCHWLSHTSKESYRLCKKDYETEEARAQQKAAELLMAMMNDYKI